MNHLDIESQEVLQSVLKDFNGTIILVSHDRFLIDGIATQIWEVLPKKKTLQIYQGTYSQYKEWLKQKDEDESAKAETIKQGKNKKTAAQNVSLQSNRKLKQKKSFLEEEIQKIEEECSIIGAKLENKGLDFEVIAQLGLEYNALQDQLNQMLEEWASINIDE